MHSRCACNSTSKDSLRDGRRPLRHEGHRRSRIAGKSLSAGSVRRCLGSPPRRAEEGRPRRRMLNRDSLSAAISVRRSSKMPMPKRSSGSSADGGSSDHHGDAAASARGCLRREGVAGFRGLRLAMTGRCSAPERRRVTRAARIWDGGRIVYGRAHMSRPEFAGITGRRRSLGATTRDRRDCRSF